MIYGPDGQTYDLDVDLDVEEAGGIDTENLVQDWLSRTPSGLTATELSERSGLTLAQAEGRLVNLYENSLCCVEGGLVNGRFFAMEEG